MKREDVGILAVPAASISALDLNAAMQTEASTARTYQLWVKGHAEPAQMFFPDLQRAGISWGSDTDWTDARSVDEAVQRFVDGEMVN